MLSNLLWQMRQNQDINEANIAAARSETRAGIAEDRVKRSEDRIDELALICLALWSLLKEKVALTEQELMDRVREIDLADGVADGKITNKVAKCDKCGRIMSLRHSRCLYCGAERLTVTVFEKIL